MAEDAPTRIPMILPGTQGVIEVPEDAVDGRLAMGWKKVRAKRSSDTGSVPVQRQDPR